MQGAVVLGKAETDDTTALRTAGTVECRNRDHRHAVLDGQPARKVRLVQVRYIAVVGQHEKGAGTGERRQASFSQPAGEPVSFLLVERSKVAIARWVGLQICGDSDLHGGGHGIDDEL